MDLHNIQYLRATAAIYVVIFHLPDFGSSIDRGSFYSNLIASGAAGVDLFFVISGFIMAYSFNFRPTNSQTFLVRRFLRIVPLYWLVSSAYWGALFIGSAYFRENYLSYGYFLSSLGFVSQLLGYGKPFLIPGWTLEYEFLFYIIFAISIYFYRPLLSLNFILLVTAFLSGNWIILEFAMGILAFLIRQHINSTNINGNLTYTFSMLLGIFLFMSGLIAGFALDGENSDTSLPRTLAWGAPAFFIVLGAAGIRQRACRALAFLGDASYSIYLTHGVAIALSVGLIGKSSIPMTSVASQVLTFSFCIAAGCLTYAWLERPLMKGINRRFRSYLSR